MAKERIKSYILLHMVLLLYSMGGICSKLAAGQSFLSLKFILFYGILLLNLAVYALLWQQILKCLPLVTAYANKAITVIWGMLWGYLFFQEQIRVQQIIGGLIILTGIILFDWLICGTETNALIFFLKFKFPIIIALCPS